MNNNQTINNVFARAINSACETFVRDLNNKQENENHNITHDEVLQEVKANNDMEIKSGRIINDKEANIINIPINEFNDILKKLEVFQNLLAWFYEDYYESLNTDIQKLRYQQFEQASKTKDFIIIMDLIVQTLTKYKTASSD